jgi:D-glycero-alpha-D-manno-heptose-7-phosphate kinase
MSARPLLLINSSAPTRICDNGGWTDIWFAQHGAVFNIAIEPRAEVQIAVYPRNALEAQLMITAENFGDTYARDLGTPWQKHPLLEAAVEQVGVPEDASIHIHLTSDAPPGASLGTSAAVLVALIGALDCLTPGRSSAHEIARQAHQVETVQLGRQSGIQDQLAAAYGGINYIEMVQYPHAHVSSIQPDDKLLWELERRLLVVYLGRPHDSSRVHEKVITHLEHAGPDEPRLTFLRRCAADARDALLAGDLDALGQAFIANTEGQRRLHPDLINPMAEQIIELARTHQAAGWKVNGAGGQGGSIALLLHGSAHNKGHLIQEIASLKGCSIIKPRLARNGLSRTQIN